MSTGKCCICDCNHSIIAGLGRVCFSAHGMLIDVGFASDDRLVNDANSLKKDKKCSHSVGS